MNGSLANRRDVLPISVLLVLPVILALAHRDWLYTPIGYLDPWYNVGYFLHYSDPTFLAGHYKESRLSWIAPGFITYQLLNPRAANFALHVGALVTSTVFLYLTLARLITREVALIVSVLLTFYIPFLGSGGWDYQTTPSGAYYAVTLFFLTRAAESLQARPWLLASGAAFAATVHADVIFVNMVPVLVAHYFVIGRIHRSWRGMRHAATWALLGFLALTLLLCLFAWSVGRAFLFFWPIVELVFRFVSDSGNERAWWLPWSSLWFLSTTSVGYLAIPFATFVASLSWLGIAFLRRSNMNRDPVRLLLIGQFACLGSVWLFWQSVGHDALQPDYFAYPLIIPAFLAIGGLAAKGNEPLPPSLLASAALLVLILSSSSYDTSATIIGRRVPLVLATSAVLLILVCSFTVAWHRSILLTATMAVFVVTYAFGNSGAVAPMSVWTRAGRNCLQAEQSFTEIVALNQLFRRLQPVWWETWLWIGPDETVGSGAGCEIKLSSFRASLSSSGTSSLGASTDHEANDITDQSVGFVSFDGLVGAFVLDKGLLDGLIARFERAGKILKLVHQETITIGGAAATFVLFRVNYPSR
jgi:hypothetical protein